MLPYFSKSKSHRTIALRLETKQTSIPIAKPFLALLVVSFLAGCGKIEERVTCQMPFATTTPPDTASTSQPLDVSIYVDGSDSMLGFVSRPNSNYVKMMEILATSITEDNNTRIEYYRLGETKPLTRTRFRQDSKLTIFYDSKDPTYQPITSPIQSAIIPPAEGREKLTIIVTDLEGDDPGKLIEALNKNYFTRGGQDYTIGFIGVKSQFDGVVFNPFTGKAKFKYTSDENNPDTYRPFYLILIGKFDRIARYFEEYKRLAPDLQQYSEMFIFPGKNVLKHPVSLGSFVDIQNNSQLPEGGQIERVFALSDARVVVTPENEKTSAYDFLNIISNDQPTVTIKYSTPFPQLATPQNSNNTLLITEDNLTTKTRVYTFNPSPAVVNEAGNNTGNQTVSNSPTSSKKYFRENPNVSLQQALTISDLQLDYNRQTLEFLATLDINKLPQPQIYLFETDLILNELEGLDWWYNWSDNSGTDGSKTLNLSIFMNRLKTLSMEALKNESNDVVIGRFCIGVQKNK
ncbi:MAG: hypothetical protein RML10_10355 [Geminocystis sp.]|nr:hypothetical protein [Geminocystis sp.]MCX8079186.1 hypothetical protein [Geminocystis sp.]MDW8463962.1 hypothetical protein [Geminocystis sp.]